MCKILSVNKLLIFEGERNMTYSQAKKTATKNNQNITYKGDAGNNCTFEVYYCSTKKRQIWATVLPSGIKIY